MVEEENFLILDGHHRFEVAKKMKIKKIPAIFVKYDETIVWSLREKEKVDVPTVIKRAKEGSIYPNKTVKHKFSKTPPNCKIEISKLI